MEEFDKRKKIVGEPVSKEEVLKALGHPRTWWPRQRRNEFWRHLLPGQKQMSINGLKGYLKFLKQSLEKPPGANTGLVSDEENAEISRSVQAKISKETEKCEKRLARLEKNPLEVAFYISDLERNIDMYQSMGWMDENEELQGLKEIAVEANKENRTKIDKLQAELTKYKELFHQLRVKYYKKRRA